jgi:hypothetical protein
MESATSSAAEIAIPPPALAADTVDLAGELIGDRPRLKRGTLPCVVAGRTVKWTVLMGRINGPGCYCKSRCSSHPQHPLPTRPDPTRARRREEREREVVGGGGGGEAIGDGAEGEGRVRR